MHARALIAALIVSTTLFSGCLGGDEAGPAGTSTSATTTAAANTTTPDGPGGEANRAPVALVKVLQNGTEIGLANGSYVVDAALNVTLDASGSTDADGDELVFTWTVNGTELDADAAVVELALAAGNHTVDLVISDGADESIVGLALVSLGGATAGPVDDAAIVTLITGSFAQGDDEAKTVMKPFEVPAGAKQITVWVTWNDGVLENGPLITDIDAFLVGPDGKDVDEAATSDFEFMRVNDPDLLAPGTWNVRLLPYGDGIAGAPVIPVDTAYTVKVIVWMVTPTVQEFKGTVAGGVHLGTAADTAANKVHELDLAAGPGAVSARLTWSNAASAQASSAVRRTNDYDLTVKADGKTVMSSGNGFATEFASLDAEPMESLAAGKWTFEVVPFEILTADYVLTVEYA